MGLLNVSTKHIRKQLSEIWPDLKFIVLTDTKFYLPTVEQLNDFLQNHYEKREYVQTRFECEEIAMDFVVQQRLWQGDGKYNWAVGWVVGTRFAGRDVNHYQNICFTQQGIMMVEAQTLSTWRPDSGRDDIYFLCM